MITNATNVRTDICGIIPIFGLSHSGALIAFGVGLSSSGTSHAQLISALLFSPSSRELL